MTDPVYALNLIGSGLNLPFYSRHVGISRFALPFLRAERRRDGTRPFKLVETEPLQTSYGTDLYRAIFGDVSGKIFQREGQGQ